MSESAWVVVERDLVEVAGKDSIGYLQGQLSQDIDSIDINGNAWTFVLAPTGRVESWFRAHRSGPDRFVLDVEVGHGAALVERLRRFLIRTDATVASVATSPMLSMRSAVPVAELVPAEADDLVVALVSWPGIHGFDVIATQQRIAQIGIGLARETGSFDDNHSLEMLRVRNGVPQFGAEIEEGSLPAEAGRAVLDASVSFTKGCYTGQELVARMNSRGGHAPKRLRRLKGRADLDAGVEVVADGEVVGTITSAAGNRAISLLKRRVEPGSMVMAGDVSAEVEILPGDELT